MEDHEIDACVSDAGWQCPVETCKQILSRKQTLRSHLSSVHNIACKCVMGTSIHYACYANTLSFPYSTSVLTCTVYYFILHACRMYMCITCNRILSQK